MLSKANHNNSYKHNQYRRHIQWHMLGSVCKDVRDYPHGRLWRVNIRVAHHKL